MVLKVLFRELVAIWLYAPRGIVGLCDEKYRVKEVLNRKKEQDKQT